MTDSSRQEDERERQLNAIIGQYYVATEQGLRPNPDAFVAQHPEFERELREFFEDLGNLEGAVAPADGKTGEQETLIQNPRSSLRPGLASANGPAAGTIVRYFGEYEILGQLGAGGMGVVYKARQSKLGRIVALKMIKAGELANPQDLQRFQAEAKAAARLSHPGIVSVHEVGSHNGQHFYTMDYVDGGSLSKLQREEQVSAIRAADLVKQLATAVQYAHGQGIVHRDLKPANVLLAEGGSPRITDFGLAKRMWVDDDSLDASLTESGQIIGTAGYMSPEQAAGKTRLVGAPADIYSLGAVLYALLTSRAPFVGESQADTIQQVIHKEPVSPRILNPSIARDLETICLKCLEKEPHKRYGTAQLLADDLERYLGGRPVVARPISPGARSVRWCRRNPWVATALVLMVVLAVGAPPVAIRQYRLTRDKEKLVDEKVGLISNLQKAVTKAQADAIKIGKQKDEIADLLVLTKAAEKKAKAAASEIGKQKDEIAGLLLSTMEAEKTAKKAQEQAESEAASNFRTLYITDMQRMAGLWDEANIRTMREHLARYLPIQGRPDLRDFEWYYWQRKCNQQVRHFQHEPGIQLLALSPDGQWLATAGPRDAQSYGVKVRNLVTGDIVGPLLNSSERIVAVRFAADGSQLVIVQQGWGDVATVLNWPATTTNDTLVLQKELPPQVPLDRKLTSRYAISPRGTLVAQSLLGVVNCRRLNDEQLIRIKLADQSFKRVRTYRSDQPPINTPDGIYTYFRGIVPGLYRVRNEREVVDRPNVMGSDFGAQRLSIQAWNLNDLFAPTIEEDGDPVFALEFSPDENRLAAGSRHGDLIVWELSTGTELIRVAAHADIIWDMAFSPDGNQVATASKDGQIKIWDIASKKPLTTIQAHTGGVRTVAYSKRGVLISGGDDHVVQVWSPVTGKRISSFRGHEQSVQDLVLHPEGEKILSSSRDGTVKEWSIEKDDRPVVIASRQLLTCLDISSSGDFLAAAGGRSNAVTVWELATGQITATLRGVLPGPIIRLQISPKGDTVAAATSRGGITTWDLAAERIVSTHNLSHKSKILAAAAISPTVQQAVGASEDGGRHLFDLETGTIMATLQGESRLEQARYSPDGTELLTFIRHDDSLDIRLWNAGTGAKLEDIPAGASAEVAAFSSDGKLLTWGKMTGEDNPKSVEIHVWDRSAKLVNSRLSVPAEFSHIRALVFSPDHRLLAASVSRNLLPRLGVNGETALLIYEVSTGSKLHQINESGTSLSFTPDGNRIAVAGESGNVKFWSLTDGLNLQELSRSGGPVGSVIYDSKEQLQVASQVTPIEGAMRVPVMIERTFVSRQNPSKQRIGNHPEIPMPRTPFGSAVFWLHERDPAPHFMVLNADELKRAGLEVAPLKPFRLHAYAPAAKSMFVLSPNGTLLRAFVRSPNEIPVQPSNEIKKLGSRVDPSGNIAGASGIRPKFVDQAIANLEGAKAMAVSPDGRWMALAVGNAIQLWDGEKLELLYTLSGHEGSVGSLAFSGDGQLLASGGLDRSVRLWNTRDGKNRTTSLGHLKPITCLAFSKMGQTVASSSHDGTIWLWDTVTGEAKTTLSGHVGPVNWIEFSPDGDELASAGDDGTIRLWRAPANASQ